MDIWYNQITIGEQAVNVYSGMSLATLEENRKVNITLPAVSNGVSFTLIAGELPYGLYLSQNYITGTPVEVSQPTTSTFVIRATHTSGVFSDRTFSITINGADIPTWITPEGLLPVSETGLLFILDNTYVEYQLQAYDTDTSANGSLIFFIADGDGSLPPGLTLSESGNITGIVEPIIALDQQSGNGYYDTQSFDRYYFDFGDAPRTGMSTFPYDSYFYDYYSDTQPLRKLNRHYEFIVSVTDGINIIPRKFNIYVVGDDFVRASNDIEFASSGVLTSDNTYLRAAYWLTNSDLGKKRASNFVSITLKTFDPNPNSGLIYYKFESNNNMTAVLSVSKSSGIPCFVTFTVAKFEFKPKIGTFYTVSSADNVLYNATCECTATTTNTITLKYLIDPGEYTKSVTYLYDPVDKSQLPDGLFLDSANGEIFGFIPYQPAITTQYNFTISALKYDSISSTSYVDLTIRILEFAAYGQKFVVIEPLQQSEVELLLNEYLRIGNYYYEIEQYELTSSISAKLYLKQNLYLDVPKNTVISKRMLISVSDSNMVKTPRTFKLNVIGELESTINWITDTNLGSIQSGYPSMISVVAETSVPNATLTYRLTNGKLPSGLSLTSNGEITGNIQQVDSNVYITATTIDKGVTTIDNSVTTVDIASKNVIVNGITFIDRDNTTIDNGQTTIDRLFHFTIKAEDQLKYSAIEQEFSLYVIVPYDTSHSNIYAKPYQKLNNRTAFNNFINDSTIFTTDKIYRPSDKNFGLQKELKMLIYPGVETLTANQFIAELSAYTNRMRVKLGNVKKAIAKHQGSNIIEYEVIYIEVIDQGINILTNITPNLKFLPLWMLTPQDNRSAATGFIKAIPICYCKPGEADYILLNIIKSGFDFKLIDFEIDRYIIDQTIDNPLNQYLKFNNYNFTV